MRRNMNKFADKIKRVNESIKRNGINTQFRRLFQYIKCGKAVPDEYEEWMRMNEPDKKGIEASNNYNSWFNCSFAIVSEDDSVTESLNNQTYKNWHQIKREDILKDESDYIIFIGKNIELAKFALFNIVKNVESVFKNIKMTGGRIMHDRPSGGEVAGIIILFVIFGIVTSILIPSTYFAIEKSIVNYKKTKI